MKKWKINGLARIKDTWDIGVIKDIKNNKCLISYRDKKHRNVEQWVHFEDLTDTIYTVC